MEDAMDVTIGRNVKRRIVADAYLELPDKDVCSHCRDLRPNPFEFKKPVDQSCTGRAIIPDLLRSPLVLICYAPKSSVDVTAHLFVEPVK